jgi:hypothetical protein
MKLETIKHPTHTVSCVSDSMADHFKYKITNAQYEVLKNNVYTLESDDVIYDSYHGCGCGWIEIDKYGNAIDLQYLDEDVVDWRDNGYNEWDDEYAEVAVIASQEAQSLYINTGQKEQNVNMLEFHTDQLTPTILHNGNIRVLVNFSSYQLVRF